MGLTQFPALTTNLELGSAAFLDAGTSVGKVPIIPVPMSSMSSPVKATIDAITNLEDSAAFHEGAEFANAEETTASLLLKEDVVTVDSLKQDLSDANNNFLYLLRWVITTFGEAPEGLEGQIESALGV